jgi:alkanesulfonate monooxygenase SsuD/methylene tetrahydromethanopterin reductase-like flavin-dependent oxidoreductase (luciferase family)
VDFERGSEMGEFDRSDQRVTVSVGCCALDNRERARHLAREHLAFYVGGMGTFYREAMVRQGYEETANTIAQRWGSGDKEAAIDAINDDVLDAFSAAGHPEECRERLAAFERIDGVDAIAVSFPRAADGEEIAATTETLAAD